MTELQFLQINSESTYVTYKKKVRKIKEKKKKKQLAAQEKQMIPRNKRIVIFVMTLIKMMKVSDY